jgi:hypothetical protein
MHALCTCGVCHAPSAGELHSGMRCKCVAWDLLSVDMGRTVAMALDCSCVTLCGVSAYPLCSDRVAGRRLLCTHLLAQTEGVLRAAFWDCVVDTAWFCARHVQRSCRPAVWCYHPGASRACRSRRSCCLARIVGGSARLPQGHHPPLLGHLGATFPYACAVMRIGHFIARAVGRWCPGGHTRHVSPCRQCTHDRLSSGGGDLLRIAVDDVAFSAHPHLLPQHASAARCLCCATPL